jgi:uncharacterized membrane protein
MRNTSRTDDRDRNGNTGINVGSIERIACAVAGGALAAYGLKRRSIGGLGLTLAGTALLHRGVSGHCNTYQALGITTNGTEPRAEVAKDIHVEKSIIIDKPAAELFSFWRNFENLPRFMNNLESVTCSGINRSHWVAKGPGGKHVEWDAEVYNEEPNEFIAWRSLEHADVVNAGSVHFNPVGGRGTEVKVVTNYNLPGGKLSALFAKLFGSEPGQMIAEDLRRLKQFMETGEIATTEGQPSGRAPEAKPYQSSAPEKETFKQPVKTRAATSHS